MCVRVYTRACVVRVPVCMYNKGMCHRESHIFQKMLFTQPRGFLLFHFQRTKTTTPHGSERHIWGEISTISWHFFLSHFIFKQEQGLVLCNTSSFWDTTTPLEDEDWELWICPHARDVGQRCWPKLLAQVSLITMFIEGLNRNYMMLTPSASSYPGA